MISLDFELMWGMFDKVTTESYGENIRGAHTAIPELLALFEQYETHATWATVGMLMHKNNETLKAHLPAENFRPTYKNAALSSYDYFSRAVDGRPDMHQYHFAPELVGQIVNTPGQELASHTFSHYYCLDGSENSEAIFTADCAAMQTAADHFGVTLTSIVFPRNQTTPPALATCSREGILAYRGTEEHFLYRARKENQQTNPLIRAVRLLDHYLNLSGHHTHKIPAKETGIVNVPASRFLRPYSPSLRQLEPLRLRRIKNAMTHAAKTGEVFHLWWHPHNFGTHRKENFANLIEILEHFKELEHEYGMQSRNMTELATLSRVVPDVIPSAVTAQSEPV